MNVAQAIVCGGIRLYRAVMSPLLHAVLGPGCGCRFTPTCSEYALDAVRQYGAARGGWLAVRRVCRCHPWGKAGWDPVPPKPTGAPTSPLPLLPAPNEMNGGPAALEKAAGLLNCTRKI